MGGNIVDLFPGSDELDLDEVLTAGITDEGFIGFYEAIFNCELFYDEETGMPIFEEANGYLQFAYAYIGYLGGMSVSDGEIVELRSLIDEQILEDYDEGLIVFTMSDDDPEIDEE